MYRSRYKQVRLQILSDGMASWGQQSNSHIELGLQEILLAIPTIPAVREFHQVSHSRECHVLSKCLPMPTVYIDRNVKNTQMASGIG